MTLDKMIVQNDLINNGIRQNKCTKNYLDNDYVKFTMGKASR